MNLRNKNLPDNVFEIIIKWFQNNKRDLPWRKDSDPYKIWISEIMLQQTVLKTVIPYFEKWVANWKNPLELSSASEEEVLRMWEGLGYYSRARNIHKTAVLLCEEFQGNIPDEYKKLINLPGI